MYIILLHQSTCILSWHLPEPHQTLCQQDSGGIKGHLTFSGAWTSMAHYEEQNKELKVLYWEIPGSGSINKSPFIHPAHICAVSSMGRGKLSAWAQTFTGTEGIVWKAENDTSHAFTLYSNLDILYVLIALSLSPFPTCTYTVFFSEACYYFYWAIFSRTGRARSDSLTWTLLPSSLHKTDWIWMRSLVLMSIIFISQDIFFRTLPAINYVVYLFFSSSML